MTAVSDVNVKQGGITPLVPPKLVKAEWPVSDVVLDSVYEHREAVKQILDGRDKRLLAIVGPCSVHDPEATLDYARLLGSLAHDLSEHLLVVMRLYFAKPRSTIGWKGLFYDPELGLNGGNINKGAGLVREVAREVALLGLPIATEILDPYMIQYMDDLVTWCSIGARTVESQLHREVASGLSAPVGMKNTTDGRIKSAIDAVETANHPHGFWAMDEGSRVALYQSTGNPYAHVVLRGGDSGPNYSRESIALTGAELTRRGLRPSLVVDCSHGNSEKVASRQAEVLDDILTQRQEGNDHIVGFMLESNLVGGQQSLKAAETTGLTYGQSITDACICFDETRLLLSQIPSLL
jgi:3-deoxy-7-phosphoheptulonate synthase